MKRQLHRFFGAIVAASVAISLCYSGSIVPACVGLQASQDDDSALAHHNAEIASRLSSLDPLERQHAAEELAKLAAVDQQKMVQGYRLEEKDSRVKLALDWALYRMGKSHDQASSYLVQIDSPQPLYVFLTRSSQTIRGRLIEVLGHIGDAETLSQIKPYTTSLDPKVSGAAKRASKEIEDRLSESPAETPKRPRKVGTSPSTDTP
jgi:hypothetical protein